MKTKLTSCAAIAESFASLNRVIGWRTRVAISLWCLATFTVALQTTQAGVTEAWARHFSSVTSRSEDSGWKAAIDSSGNIFVTGTTDGGLSGMDILTIKYSASGTVLWEKRYNGHGNSDDIPIAVLLDNSGNVFIAGTSVGVNSGEDFYTAKYAAANGTLLWEKRDTGPGNKSDKAVAAALDDSGNLIVTGSSDNGTNIEFYTTKHVSTNGALLWERRYKGLGNDGDDSGLAVATDSEGNVIVTGQSDGGDTWYDIYTVKYAAADGTLLWEKRYDSGIHASDTGEAVAVDGNGDVIVAGSGFDLYTVKYAGTNGLVMWEKRYNAQNYFDIPIALALDLDGNAVIAAKSVSTSIWDKNQYFTTKYAAADGSVLWERTLTNTVNVCNALALDSHGDAIVTGIATGPHTYTEFYSAKFAATNGAVLWEKQGPIIFSEGLQAIAVDADDNVVMTGSHENYASDSDFYTVKFATDGVKLWEKFYAGEADSDDQAKAVARDHLGNIIVTGYSKNGTNADYLTVKYTPEGTPLWIKRYNGPDNGDDYPMGVAVDGAGNVLVTGYSGRPNQGNQDIYTAKYAAADGALIWEKRFDENGHTDRPFAIATDSQGNAIVTGFSQSSSNTYCYTAKYAAADGARLWERRYAGPGNDSHARALAVDSDDNVIVTGASKPGVLLTSYTDYYTAKYAAADGALFWERHYNGPANGTDVPEAVTLDTVGNVIVTGYSMNGTNADYYTAKYEAGYGALLWEHRFNGPSNRGDWARAVAVDHNGNVLVTGGSEATGASWDFCTIKYDAYGALLWQNRYNGPANNNDFGLAVKVDAIGNVVVTGNSQGDCYTAKYAGTNGVLLWDRRFNGPANNSDFVAGPQGLALGRDGSVAIAGSSDVNFGGSVTYDFTTVLYREALSIVPVSGGIKIQFTAVPGNTYYIERAASLSGPWTTQATLIASTDGFLEYIDLDPGSSAFYRTRTQ